MIVLKKFGLSLLLCLLVVVTSYARPLKETNTKINTKSKQHTTAKVSNSKKSNTVSKNNSKAAVKTPTVKSKTADSKTIVAKVEPKKVVAPECENEKCVTIVTVSDRKKAPNAWSVNNDLLLAKANTKVATTTKKVAETPKEEETSFSTTVMDWVKDKYSTMIEVLPNQISNVMLYRFIDDWYGVKYRMGGTSKKGVDCSAFVQSLYKYVFDTDLVRTACMQFNSSQIIKNPAELKEGDLVFFKVNSSRISHVGVYLRNNFFVHSASSKGVSIASLTSEYWSKYFAGGGRILNN